MPAYQAVVTFPYKTGLPKDVSINTFALDVAAGAGAEWDDILTAIARFYNEPSAGAGTNCPARYYSTFFDRTTNAATIKVRQIDLTTNHFTGDPLEVEFTLGARGTGVSADDLPLECAVCCSFKTVPLTTSPGRRARGRVYLGPWSISVVTEDSSGRPLVRSDLVSDIALNSLRMLDELQDAGAVWSVWSRADHELAPVLAGWVDNEFDTQRRRESDATNRQVWSST